MPEKKVLLGYYDRKIGKNYYRYKSVRTGPGEKDIKTIYIGAVNKLDTENKGYIAKRKVKADDMTKNDKENISDLKGEIVVVEGETKIKVSAETDLTKVLSFVRKKGIDIKAVTKDDYTGHRKAYPVFIINLGKLSPEKTASLNTSLT